MANQVELKISKTGTNSYYDGPKGIQLLCVFHGVDTVRDKLRWKAPKKVSHYWRTNTGEEKVSSNCWTANGAIALIHYLFARRI